MGGKLGHSRQAKGEACHEYGDGFGRMGTKAAMSLTLAQFNAIVTRAARAPSIHNAQPARWRLDGADIVVAADVGVTLPHADPDGAGCALSCGAAVEATVLALSAEGIGAQVHDHWAQNNQSDWPGHRIAARITLTEATQAGHLAQHLEQRHTWRAAFAAGQPALYGWTRNDTALVMTPKLIGWLAKLNDTASLQALQHKPLRAELLSWMRLRPDHPRAEHDGLALAALQVTPRIGRQMALGLGPLWPVLNIFGHTKAMVAEASLTRSAPIIACFHRPLGESPIATGRAYLRMWLEATGLGLAGWPMAALTDDPTAAAQIKSHLDIPADRCLVQVIRFGIPTGPQPLPARRPIAELIP